MKETDEDPMKGKRGIVTLVIHAIGGCLPYE